MKSSTIAFILALILLFLAPMVKCGNEKVIEYINKTDTVTMSDTVYTTDTLTIVRPIPKYINILKTDTITKDTILTTEQKTYSDTICKNKDTVIVTNSIQGINANLLSTEVQLKKQEVINTIEITKYINEPKTFWKRFHIQPQITSGYDLVNKQFGVMVGVGIGFDLY